MIIIVLGSPFITLRIRYPGLIDSLLPVCTLNLCPVPSNLLVKGEVSPFRRSGGKSYNMHFGISIVNQHQCRRGPSGVSGRGRALLKQEQLGSVSRCWDPQPPETVGTWGTQWNKGPSHHRLRHQQSTVISLGSVAR